MTNLLNKFFLRIHFLEGLIHWLIQRFTAISILVSLVFVFAFDSLPLFCILGSLLIFHVYAGIQTLIDDYIHDYLFFSLSITYLRVVAVFLFKTLLVIFVC